MTILCRAYILGDILLDSDFKDAVVDTLTVYTLDHHTCHNEVKYIYGNTLKGSKLRYWLVVMVVDECGISYLALEKFYDFHTPQFLYDVLVRTDRIAFEECPRNLHPENCRASYEELLMNPCLLHEHWEEKICYRWKAALDKKVHKSP